MASEIVPESLKPAERKPDSYSSIWTYVNQLETLLEVIENDVLEMNFHDDYEKRRVDLNRVGNLLSTTRTIAGELAVAVRVR